MKMNVLKNGLRIMAVLMIATSVAGIATAETGDDNQNTVDAWKGLGAGIAVGLAAIGAGISQANIGAAAVGMLAEDSSKFGTAIIFTALPESIVILGLLPLFM
jgi:V/A-type H+-transporting ATPase subunit K